MKLLTKHITPIIAIYLVILVVLHIIPVNGNTLNNNFILGIRWDYVGHFMAFSALGFLGNLLAIKKQFNLIATNILIVLIAIALESLQYIIPYRAFNINDIIANIIGIGLGFGIIKVVLKVSRELGEVRSEN